MPRCLRAGFIALILSGAGLAPGHAQDGSTGLSGAYLAARAAVIQGDHRAAASYFDRALAIDPENEVLIGNAMFAQAALGNWTRASEIAAMVPDDAEGRGVIDLINFVSLIRDEEMSAATAEVAAQRGAGPLIDGLALGWLYLGEGNMSRATAAFEAAATDPILADMARYHLGLARAAVGDFEGADAIFSGQEFGPLQATERGVRAHAEILVQLERTDAALDLLDQSTAAIPDPALLALRDQIMAGETDTYDFVTTPRQGMAEVFYTIARGLGSEGGGSLTLLYARAAHVIYPDHIEAVLYAGNILLEGRQYAMATDTFAAIPENSRHYPEAQMGLADALAEQNRTHEAIAVLRAVTQAHPELATIQAALGDMLRRDEQCAEAIDAYTAALDLVDTDQPRYWFVFYTRAICYHEQDNWDPAEADFRRALELSPDQPNVLNYLGYSLVEQRRSLDEALGMIERAVAARPDSGYIVDSLGWVYYRLGRYDEAVAPMERAVELEPNDPVINDHLGDVYWMVGRRREAEFQWHRALSFEPDEEEAVRIRLKLDVGLDAVLEEEGGVGEGQ
jgi:tetratricopeptide (TPR) repeat protein